MKRFAIIATLGSALSILGTVLLFSFSPYLINNYLLPKILAEHEISAVMVRISHLTPWSFAGSITVGNEEASDISLPLISANYSPADLLAGKIESIGIDGVTLRLALSDGKLKLRTFTLPHTDPTSEEEHFEIPPFPFMTESLILRNCNVIIERRDLPDITFTIQGKADFNFTKVSRRQYILNGLSSTILSEGLLQASLNADVHFLDKQNTLRLEVSVPKLIGLSLLLPLPADTRITGTAHLQAALQLSQDFKSVLDIDTTLTLPTLEAGIPTFNIKSSKQTPLQLSIHGNNEILDYELLNINIVRPREIQTFMHGTVEIASRIITGEGQLRVEGLRDIASFKSQASLQPSGSHISLKIEGDKQTYQSDRLNLAIGKYTLNTQLNHSPEATRITKKMQIASVKIPEYELQFKGINSDISYLLTGKGKSQTGPGKVSIQQVQYKNENLAGITAGITQAVDGVLFRGQITSHMANPFQLQFNGSSTLDQPFTSTFTLPESAIDNNSLPKFISLPSDLSFSGAVQAKANFEIVDTTPQGSLQITINDGALRLDEKKISINGIATEITLPDLPNLSSSPRQELKIGDVSIGNLKFTDGRIFFTIENEQTLFIEKSRFTWCNGKVESGSLQISLDSPELSTTLYCDRLQFSELLSQLGISDTEGDGSLNGRLPLHFTGKEMIFDDGFLFSTPGNSGIVRFNNTEMLRQGMPDMGKAAYLEYSLQAMENFSYNWTKLTFNSTGDDLLISMQIDGKPATPLPFGYQSGQLVPQAQGQGIQHPIRLDVNFHLPFTEMFKYGENLQKIMENMQ